MNLDEMKTALQGFLAMVAPENQATAAETLTTLSDEISKVYSERDTNAQTAADLTANNEKLREVNAKLFLRMGTPAENKDGNTPPESKQQEEEKKLSFDDLFNEDGGLK